MTASVTTLNDLFGDAGCVGDAGCGCTQDHHTLEAMIAAGYVRTQRHPTLPLTIYNYTPKTQFEKMWNKVTKQCRGLIVHDDGTVVARPFPKFFNWGEVNVEGFDRDSLVTVTDKADGSLGITYPRGDGSYAIATRGSFTSEQAVEAVLMMDDLYPGWTPPDGITVLFEIIYASNRIVLDYGDARELRLIDAVWVDTGWPIGSDPTVVAEVLGWPGPVVEHLGTMALKSALHHLVGIQRSNAEGVVLRFLNTDDRYKIKQDDYVALHRILTNTSARTIWTYLAVNACRDLITQPKHWGSRLGIDPKRAVEILAVGDSWEDRMLSNVPDEFYAWVSTVIKRVQVEVAEMMQHLAESLVAASYRLSGTYPDGWSRSDLFAYLKSEHPDDFGAIMALWDGKDTTIYCWKQAYPGVESPFMNTSEDTA